MFRFIFYVILFYLVVKALNSFFRWLNEPKNDSSSKQTREYSSFPKYRDVEEAEFIEIKKDSNKEKA